MQCFVYEKLPFYDFWRAQIHVMPAEKFREFKKSKKHVRKISKRIAKKICPPIRVVNVHHDSFGLFGVEK